MLKINPTQEALDFHKRYAEKVFNKLIEDKFVEREGEKKYLPNCFLRFLSNNFVELILAKPQRLLEIHQEFLKLSFSKEEHRLIKSFFIDTGYENFKNKDFLNHLNIDTCTYCNRNYTLQFDLETNHARAQLDHWFPKESFPILALSFYNLIPSCSSCNHIKGAAKDCDWLKALENLNHPYISKNDFTFSYEYENFNDFAMKIKVEKDSKSEKTLAFNRTKEIYNAQSDKELKDLLELRLKYSENYIDTLVNKTFKGVASKAEIYRMIFGIETEEDNYHKRPFSKFKKDIIEELLKIK